MDPLAFYYPMACHYWMCLLMHAVSFLSIKVLFFTNKSGSLLNKIFELLNGWYCFSIQRKGILWWCNSCLLKWTICHWFCCILHKVSVHKNTKRHFSLQFLHNINLKESSNFAWTSGPFKRILVTRKSLFSSVLCYHLCSKYSTVQIISAQKLT